MKQLMFLKKEETSLSIIFSNVSQTFNGLLMLSRMRRKNRKSNVMKIKNVKK